MYKPEERKEIIKDLCKYISKGASLKKSLRTMKKDKGFSISINTFFKWIDEEKQFLNQYTRACDERGLHIFEESLKIADGDGGSDYITDERGRLVVDKAKIQRDRLRIDTRRWFLSKLVPKKYGDKIEIELDDKTLSKEERMQRILELKKKIEDNK